MTLYWIPLGTARRVVCDGDAQVVTVAEQVNKSDVFELSIALFGMGGAVG